MRIISLTILLTSLLFSLNGNAQQRPKIGLVLSGGGAKGAAHIGVLKVLEENKIPIDYIVGTSIGAYVGGLYALGYSVNEIENIMLNLPWDKSYSDFVPRESLQYADQELRDKYNISLRIGYSAGQIKMPSGLLLGQTATQLLRRSTDVVSTFEHFDQLAIPYRAVATDLVTATAVILDAGSLTKAMSASAAVPGILEPVMIGGRLLVDGGITNNMPIDVIKKMGADIVIAVDIGSPLAKQNQINDTVDVLNQLSTIVTNNTSIEQKKRLAANDILIRPAIDELSTTDFSIMPQALILGEQSATEHLEHLSLYALNDNEYLAYIENKQRRSRQWFDSMTSPLVAIDYHNNSKVDSDIIAEHLALNTGDVVSMQTLFDAVDRVYALDKFERVDAEFIDAEDGRMLVIDTQEKTWGPNYLKFGFSLQSDFSANSIIELDFAYLLTDVTPNGGEWKNEVSVGWESMIATEFYQPIDKYQRFFSRARIEYAQDKWAQSKARPELSNDFYLSQVGLGYNYADQGVMEVGLMGERGDLSMNSQAAEQFDYKSFGAFFTVGFDDLNSINFPTHGNKLSLEVFWRNDEYSEDLTQMTSDSSIEISFNWRGALGWGNNTFVGITSLATVNNDSDFSVHVSELGGFLNISGFSKDTLIGVHKAFAAAVYQYDLGREIPGGSGLPIYLGTSVEIGNVWSINETVKADDLIKSGSLYLGTDTSFGPAVIGVGYASGGESTVFLSLGKNW